MFRVRLLLLVLVAPAFCAAQPPTIFFPPSLRTPPRSLDEFKIPPGTVVIVGDAKSALRNIDAIVLSPDEYKKLLETIDQLRKQANPDKAELPGVCRLNVQTHDEVVRVKATFEFRTVTPKSTITLGFRQANAISASLNDGKLPALQIGSDGYSAVIDEPGAHKLEIELQLPLAARSTTERSVALHLPGAAITLIERMTLPPGVQAVRVKTVLPAGTTAAATRTWSAATVKGLSAAQPAALGPVDGLELAWDISAPAKPVEPLFAADGQIAVRLSDASVETNAKLTLRSLRGPMTEWKLQTPANAEIVLDSDAGDPAPTVVPLSAEKTHWAIRVPEPGRTEIKIDVGVRSARTGQPIAVGPFVVQGAFPQRGTISVFAPSHLRPRASRLRQDVRVGESTGDAAGTPNVIFTYGNAALPAGGAAAPMLSIDAELMRGEVRTQTTHLLTLVERGWRLVTTIKITAVRTEFDRLEIELPAALQEVQSPTDAVVSIAPKADAGANRWQIQLDKVRRGEMQLQIEGIYPTPVEVRSSHLQLPRVIGAQDRDGKVSVQVPEGYEARGVVRQWERDRIGDWPHALEANNPTGRAPTLSASVSRTPARLEITWGPVQQELSVASIAEADIDDRMAVVQHQFTLSAAGKSRQIVLRALPGLTPAYVRSVEGGSLVPQGDAWVLTIPTERQTATIRYAAPLRASAADRGTQVDVGLLWPSNATRCETRVRLWGTRETSSWKPMLAAGPWEELPVEPGISRKTLAALVLQGNGLSLPLTLDLSPAAGMIELGLTLERALIQVAVSGRNQEYRARFLVRKSAASALEVELPAPPAVCHPEVRIDGIRLEQVSVRDSEGRLANATTGRVIVIPMEAASTPRTLEIRYQLTSTNNIVRGQQTLVPPQIRGAAVTTPVRWQIGIPSDTMALGIDANSRLEQRRFWRNVMMAPQNDDAGAELERWFREGLPPERADNSMPATPWDANVVATSPSLQPTHVIVVGRTMWLLMCSVVILVVGLAALFLWRRRWLFWLLATVVCGALGAVAVLWPQTLMVFMAGSIPGWPVLGVVILWRWWWQRRYERRVVFMPGFSRQTASLPPARSKSSVHKREPSTVDS